MFTVLFLGLGLGVTWYFQLIPDFWVYVLLVPLIGMAFTKGQRAYIFKRAGARCEHCGADWNDGAMLECHHEVPLSDGGSEHTDNGILLCRPCHAQAHIDLAHEAKDCGDMACHNRNAFAARSIKKRPFWRRGFRAREKQLTLFD